MFTTIAVLDGKPFLWEKHFGRLTSNAAKVGMDLSDYNERTIADEVNREIQKNGITDGRIRVTFYDEQSSPFWPGMTERKTSLSIITSGVRDVPENFKLAVSPYPVNSRSPLAGVKSCNYLEHLMALDEAKARGFDEAVQQNERGYVTSAAMANVFWLKDDIMYTPSLKTGCLPGTTREFVLENLDCREVEAAIDEFYQAEAIFLTSAGIGVVAVSQFDDRSFVPVFHPIMNLLSVARDAG